jgi:thymidylate kinase
MIIAFDGNVFTGKTSLIEKLHIPGESEVVREHNYFLDVTRTPKDAWSAQKGYLDAEVRRRGYLARLSREKPVLLDRSFVSMAAHVSGLKAARGIDIRGHFLGEIVSLIRSDKIIIPDIFIFVRCDYETIKERARKDLLKHTDELYFEQEYLEAVEHFNNLWQEYFPGRVIDTNAGLSLHLEQLILTKGAGTSHPSSYAVDDICRRLEEMLT